MVNAPRGDHKTLLTNRFRLSPTRYPSRLPPEYSTRQPHSPNCFSVATMSSNVCVAIVKLLREQSRGLTPSRIQMGDHYDQKACRIHWVLNHYSHRPFAAVGR